MEEGQPEIDRDPQNRSLSVTLGIKDYSSPASTTPIGSHAGVEEELTANEYDIRPDPESEKADLSKIRGQTSNSENKFQVEDDPETELAALAELLPEVTKRMPETSGEESGMATETDKNDNTNEPVAEESGPPAQAAPVTEDVQNNKEDKDSNTAVQKSVPSDHEVVNRQASMHVQGSGARDGSRDSADDQGHTYDSHDDNGDVSGHPDATSLDDYPESENALNEGSLEEDAENIPKEFMNSGQSISTATQTHEVRMPMYLPTFKPATGCTNASDFIVRCFVARLRSGITVVKHGRSRWCKSRLRVLQIHPDGRSLTWKPAEGEPTTNRKPPKLDLSTCLEVRHAWSPDPHNPMYTGTPILRQKCEAANAHKSFALIFKHRTVDITAVTADQCKVLMEGFSALCFRLQVASMAGRSGAKNKSARPMPDEDGVSVTASNTLTNNSATPKNR